VRNAWVAFCERVVEASDGKVIGNVEVITEERNVKRLFEKLSDQARAGSTTWV
jgi:hypothetical protein